MIKILPSILASDMLNVGADVERMIKSGVDGLHVDIMDAHFVPNLSFGPAMSEAIKKRFPEVYQDVHLMMSHPHKYIDTFVQAGASAVTIHAEADCDVAETLRSIREKGVKAGVSVKPGTMAEEILHLLPLCDLVLVMTVEPGFGGQKFMADMMPKIRALRDAGFKGQIMVDGGVNAQTGALCVEAGADALVMGTALVRAKDPAAVVAACRKLEG